MLARRTLVQVAHWPAARVRQASGSAVWWHHIPLASQTRASTAAAAAADGEGGFQPDKPTLFDASLSPFGARIRYLMYACGLEGEIERKSPKELGGLKSDEYLALHPAGKMPLLVLPSGLAVPESTVIQDYILDAMAPESPLEPPTAEARVQAAIITRYMDLYYAPLAGCMYRAMDIETRAKQLAELNAVIDTAEKLCVGPYMIGQRMSTADAALFPHFVFMTEFLPRYFGWPDVFDGRPKLRIWWECVQDDANVARVMGEMRESLENNWHSKGRWDELGITEQIANPDYKWVYP